MMNGGGDANAASQASQASQSSRGGGPGEGVISWAAQTYDAPRHNGPIHTFAQHMGRGAVMSAPARIKEGAREAGPFRLGGAERLALEIKGDATDPPGWGG